MATRLTMAEALAKAKGMDQMYLENLKDKFVTCRDAGCTNHAAMIKLGMTESEFADLPYVWVKYATVTKITVSDFGTIEGRQVYPFSPLLTKEAYDDYLTAKFSSSISKGTVAVQVYGKTLTPEQETLLKGIIDTVSGGDPEKLVANLEAFGYTPTKEQLTAALKAAVRREVLEEIKAEEEAKAKTKVEQ